MKHLIFTPGFIDNFAYYHSNKKQTLLEKKIKAKIIPVIYEGAY